MALPATSLMVPTGAIPIDMTPFNRGDGAPTSAPILVHFGVDVASSFLADETQTASTITAASPIALLNESTGERVPFLSENGRPTRPQRTTRHALIIRPLTPLDVRDEVRRRDLRARSSDAERPSAAGLEGASVRALRDAGRVPTSRRSRQRGATSRRSSPSSRRTGYGAKRPGARLGLHDWPAPTRSLAPSPRCATRSFNATTSAAVGSDAGADASSDASADASRAARRRAPLASLTRSGRRPFSLCERSEHRRGDLHPPSYLKADNTIDYTADNLPVPNQAFRRPCTRSR